MSDNVEIQLMIGPHSVINFRERERVSLPLEKWQFCAGDGGTQVKYRRTSIQTINKGG